MNNNFLSATTTPVDTGPLYHRTSRAGKLHSLTPLTKCSYNPIPTLIRPTKKSKYLIIRRATTPVIAIFPFILIVSLQILAGIALGQEQSDQGDNIEETGLRLFGGYNWYAMEDFNRKLKQEGNKAINGGSNVGIELSHWTVDIPRLNIPIKVPVFGIEYLGASSKTTHADAMGSATVDWSLPVIGGYITADIPISDETTWFHLRPISIGIYNLGALLNARLTVSDRAGRLDVSGSTIGVSTGINFRHRFVEKSPFSIFMAASYRWLEFTDVDLTPEGGFTVTAGGGLVQPSTLPASFDYGGFTVRGGVDVEF